MKPARIIVLVISLAAGAVAAMLASGNRRPEAPPPPPPLATVEVLVAKTDLETGKVIVEGDVGWQTWPAASTASNLIRKTDRPEAIKEFVGAIVRTPVSAGEPIRDSKVVLAKGGGFMAAILPRGMRAISLDIAADTDAGGFILPNDHVDVVLTQKPSSTTNQAGFVTKTILSNVLVLAVDQTIGEKDGQKVIVGKTATIQVDPRQAEILANARQQGTVSLALRSLLDSQTVTPDAEEAAEVAHFIVVYRGRVREAYRCTRECLLWAGTEGQQTVAEVGPAHGCGTEGGPGYRGPDGKCLSWRDLGKTCGCPPTNRCTSEQPAPDADKAACDGVEIEKLKRNAHAQ